MLRSDVELQAREQKLILARNNLAKQKRVLARAIGLPASQAFDITTEVAYQPLTTSTLDEALQQAYSSRPDYESVTEQVRSAELQKRAASAERYPTLSAIVDYGSIGTNFASNRGTVDAAAQLRLPFSREAGFTEIALLQIPSWQAPSNDWKTCMPSLTRRFAMLSLTCRIPSRKCPLSRMPSASLLRPCSNRGIASRPAAQGESLGHWSHCLDGGVSRSARYEHRQCRLALHCGESWCQLRRQHVGTYLVFGSK